MSDVRLNFNATSDTYELGADVDGVFVPLLQTPGPQVRAHVENVQSNESAAAPATGATTPTEGTAATNDPTGENARLRARVAELEAAAAAGVQPPSLNV